MMKFGNPFFLFGLFALIIPIIVHLFNFRRFKKVYFSDISFLKEIKEQTQSKNKLKHYLVLLSRLLFITALVLAFAQPYIPFSNQIKNGNKLISVFIDNSFSMNANGAQGRLLDVAKKAAIELAKGYKETDRFQLLTNDFEGKHQRFYSRDEFIKYTEEIKESPGTRKISEILSRQRNAFNQTDPSNNKSKTSYLISDFQKTILKNDLVYSDSSVTNYFIPLQTNESNNVYIDTVWFEQAIFKKGENNLLYAKIINTSTTAIENKPLNLFINEKSAGMATLNIEPQNEAIVTLPINIKTPGLVNAYLSIDDYPINYDDKFYFSFMVYEKLNVLLINGKKSTPYLQSLLKNDNFFNLTVLNEQQIQLSELNNKQLIILNEAEDLSGAFIQELKRKVINGVNQFIIPSNNYKENQLNALKELGLPELQSPDTGTFTLEKPDLKNSFFNSVFDEQKIPKNEKLDLPVAHLRYLLLKGLTENSQPILNYTSGLPYLFLQQINKGKIYFLTSTLQLRDNNLAKHALFIPILYRIALSSLNTDRLYYKIGENARRIINTQRKDEEDILKIKSTDNKNEFIPQQNNNNEGILLNIGEIANPKPGNYRIVNSENDILDGISLNYNRNESELKFSTEDELKEFALKNNFNLTVLPPKNSDFTHLVKQESEGKKLWKWFIIFALISLISETLLIRYLK
jgi:hypothetical protein